jgi:steroid delta-isomerase-like uncharacterized protein
MSNEIKTIVRSWLDALNAKDPAALDAVIHPNYRNSMFPEGMPGGPEGEKAFLGMWIAAFPDFRIEPDAVVAEDDRVAVSWGFTGTQKGEFMGIPATGRAVRMSSMNLLRIADGKIVDNRPQVDMLGLLQQLGVIQTP